MSFRKILHGYQLAEAKGQLKEGTAVRATFATILEAGIVAFHRGFFGRGEWNRVAESVASKEGGENLGALQEALLTDVTRITSALKEAHTTTDFPVILSNLRNRVMRQSYNPVESAVMDFAIRRETSDFKQLKGIRIDTFNRLIKRPEGTDVQRTTFGYTEDGYSIANYELAFDFTWEMWKNDDIGLFRIGMENLGVAARRTRALVTYEAIAAGLSATTLDSAAGGPTIDRVSALVQSLAEETNSDGKPTPYSLSDIAYGAKWRTTAASTLNSQNVLGPTSAKTPQANPVYQTATPHEEPMMAEVLGSDWLGWDNRNPWLEFAVLEDFVGGPLTYAQMPDVTDHVEQGSFNNHSLSVKVGDAVGAKVTSTEPVRRVLGA